MRPSTSRRRKTLLAVALAGAMALAVGGITGATLAAFSSNTTNADSLTAAPDWVPPTVTGTTIAKIAGGLVDYIKQGGLYYVYANASDTGNPASGVSVLTANVSSVTTGQTLLPLVTAGCPCSVGGTSYAYRSAPLAANVALPAGAYTYSITATDGATNSATQNGFPVTVDNTAPSASDVQTANKAGGTVGQAEQGDSITYTFSEQIDPNSILAGWTGSSQNVVVHINQIGGPADDTLTVYDAANTVQLPFGSADLGNKGFVSANTTFGATGTASTMVQSGASVTITLGNPSGATGTSNKNGTMIWTPSTTPTDSAGNACLAVAATESGGADKEF